MILIDAGALINRIVFYTDLSQDVKETVEDEIVNAQTIDAVEVVRCRNCKHVQKINCPFFKAKWGYTDDDYCSCGERREDGEA
jgi:hypothetical protein